MEYLDSEDSEEEECDVFPDLLDSSKDTATIDEGLADVEDQDDDEWDTIAHRHINRGRYGRAMIGVSYSEVTTVEPLCRGGSKILQ